MNAKKLLLVWSWTTFLSPLLGLEIDRGEVIMLYNENDKVTEFTDETISTIYNSPYMWVVEFYAHWCGHCQKFANTWKKIANEMHDWNDMVRIGAMNCAQQSKCNDFNIHGTPTIRVFFPRVASGLGLDIPHSMDVGFNRAEILKALELAQSHNLLKKVPRRNLIPFASIDLNSIARESSSASKVALIVEDTMDQYGREVIFVSDKKFPNLHVRRIDWMHLGGVHYLFQSGHTPTVLVVDIVNNEIDWSKTVVFHPVASKGSMSDQVINFFKTVSASKVETKPKQDLIETSTLTSGVEVAPIDGPDVVYASDLERSIRYALTVEIPTHQFLDEIKMKTLYQYLEVIIRFLPLRAEVVKFLKALREWPIRMELRAMKSSDFLAKVNELMEIYEPFKSTPDKWIGCKGSLPHLRGYPCSVWIMFHTLTVNAAIRGDPAMAIGGRSLVAKAMVNYVYHFFTCRKCAENFAAKVTYLGFLPTTPTDSIMWLWQIHNLANLNLKGDVSEDPAHPKNVWPSNINCPECRTLGTFSIPNFPDVVAQTELWNVKATTDYLTKIYREENIIKNSNDNTVSKTDAMMKLIESTMSNITNKQGQLAIDLKSLIAINNYCVKVYSLSTELNEHDF